LEGEGVAAWQINGANGSFLTIKQGYASIAGTVVSLQAKVNGSYNFVPPGTPTGFATLTHSLLVSVQ